MKSFKKILCIVLASVLLSFSFIPAFAAEPEGLTYLYIDKGSITIGDGTVSGYGYWGQKITTPNENGYCIVMAEAEKTSNTVIISGGENFIALKNVNIYVSGTYTCGFRVQNGAKADIYFTGDNTLVSGESRAGLEISQNSTVTLSGDGVLKAGSPGQAGIGGGSGAANGTLIINSGTIISQCNSEGAGIGGGSSGAGGNITINGGNVTAIGGENGAGIGGGNSSDSGNITINGGTVTATGGENGAGIGGGWFGEMGSVVINGGSVKAAGGGTAPAIGNGTGLKYKLYPVNSQGITVHEYKIACDSFDKLLINDSEFVFDGTHKDDTYYYIYLPEGTNFIAKEHETEKANLYKAVVSSNGTVSPVEISPVEAINGAQIGSDNIIRGISCGLTNLDGYLSIAEGYTLAYDNDYMGTGTHATVMYGDTPVYTYRTLLYGDVNNDGFYDGEDSFIVLVILCRLLTRDSTDPLVFEAADADRNGIIMQDDMELLEQAGLLLSTVSQQTGEIMTADSFEEYVCLVDQTPHRRPAAAEEAEEKTQNDEEQEAQINEPSDAQEEFPVENNMSFFDILVKFIKNAVKFFSSVYSFWKNYFI